MSKQVIQTTNAPAPVGVYSQAIQSGNTVYVSGQIPLDPHTGALVMDSFEAQVHQVVANVKAVLEAAGSDLNNIVKASIFLTDMSKFAQVNTIYETYFSEPFPARAVVEVAGLPKGVDIEMDAIAVL